MFPSSMPKLFSSEANRQSNRLAVQESIRILDEQTRKRRIQKQLRTLEQDNVQDDPHANLMLHKSAPKFSDELVLPGGKQQRKRPAGIEGLNEPSSKKKKKLRAEHTKTRFRKTFTDLLDEHMKNKALDQETRMAYENAAAPPSNLPQRKFCAVCGFHSKYTCIRCGSRYCSIPCRDTHNDTRCLKWTA
uniref:HIT-type domain-containing protein n=1 Tax=Acrobeloides nanus TaxID=290746 RepID=A0A914CF70_9BILA